MADVAATAAAPPTFKKRVNKNIRKRPATPPPAATDSPSDASTDDDDDDNDDEANVRIKRRRTTGLQSSTSTSLSAKPPADLSKATKFAADKSLTIASSDDATRTSHWETETARSVVPATTSTSASPATDGTYRGPSTYGTFIAKSRDRPVVGPVRGAASNVRQVTVTDFAPDVCKDYKQTGYCGFGDSCKFLHAREDYQAGWQLDQEWEKTKKKNRKQNANQKKVTAEDVVDDDDDEEQKLLASIPFKCIICKGPYDRPVVTRCRHYFCEKCAMTRYMKEKKKGCANCGADTNGTFNAARKLTELLERKRKRVEEARSREGDGEEDEEGGDS
nr:pre-mrna-splicing factor cwc24 [Quercus suber]